jgi:hypothetical protein
MVSLGLLLSLLMAAPEAPETPAPLPSSLDQPAREWKLRLTAPWLSGRYEFLGPKSDLVYPEHYQHWMPSILVGSLACEFVHRWTAEVGGGIGENLRRVAYVRGGPMVSLVNRPTASVSLQGLLSLSYRSHGYDPRSEKATGRQMLSADAGVAIEATRWWPSGWGVSLRGRSALARVLAASGPTLWADPEDPGVYFQDDANWALELGLDIGLTWR